MEDLNESKTDLRCGDCGQWKPVLAFEVRADTGKPMGSCRECKRAHQRVQRAARKQRQRPANKAALPKQECTRCKEMKVATDFNWSLSEFSFLQSRCKLCQRIITRERRTRLRQRPEPVHSELPSKTCPKCKREQPATSFTLNMNAANFLHGYCKECNAAQTAISVKKNVSEEMVRKSAPDIS